MSENNPVEINIPDSAVELAKEVYNDAGKPASTELGQAAGTIVGLINTILLPAKVLNATMKIKADKFIADYEKRISEIPENKRIEANPAIVGPMAEHLKYKLTEDTLREHYLTLMSSVSNSDNACKPLIAFDNVLNQLTPIELKLLNHLFASRPQQNYPVAHIKRQSPNSYTIAYRNLSDIKFESLSFDALSVIISNYERLGIISISTHEYVEPVQERYKYVSTSSIYKTLEATLNAYNIFHPNAKDSLVFDKRSFSATPFGKSFVETIFG